MRKDQLPELQKDQFSDFQLKEYENISQAHFKTNEAISTFYRYYLLVMVVPITAISVWFSKSPSGELPINDGFWKSAFAIFLFIVGVFGAGILFYIEGLRLDAVLYARVVNSVRKHFFTLKSSQYSMVAVLPTNITVPKFSLSSSHWLIFLSSALFNSFYLVVGALLFFEDLRSKDELWAGGSFRWIWYIVFFLSCMSVQIYYANYLANEKERLYS